MKKRYVHIAVSGCTHGFLDQVYDEIKTYEKKNEKKVDILLSCGDFKAIRNMVDLQTITSPKKHKKMFDFYKYYGGKKTPYVTTVFCGGNHEALNHSYELYYGGWACPGIYFLGNSGCINFKGLRIAGLSGTYEHFMENPQSVAESGYYERMPFEHDVEFLHTFYMHREFEVRKLSMLTGRVDIMLTHDWPVGIWEGAKTPLRSHWVGDIKKNRFGSPLAGTLLQSLKPRYWFSGHMHTNFYNEYQHSTRGQTTIFQAVTAPDKVKEGCSCLKYYTIPVLFPDEQDLDIKLNDTIVQESGLYYDLEWLSITRVFNEKYFSSRKKFSTPFPKDFESLKREIEKERRIKIFDLMRKYYEPKGCGPLNSDVIEEKEEEEKEGPDGKEKVKFLEIEKDLFVRNKDVYPGGKGEYLKVAPPRDLDNPQRDRFCKFLEIVDRMKEIVGDPSKAKRRGKKKGKKGKKGKKKKKKGKKKK